MRCAWVSAKASLIAVVVLGLAGCLSDAIKQNQEQIDRQKAELAQLEQQIAALKAAQQPAYSTAPPVAGACDKSVMQTATRRGGERFAAGEFNKALGYYQDAVTACPTSAQAELNVARAFEALGDRDQAISYYRRAAAVAPADQDADPALADQARRALARLAAK
jgi:tetratricopeptide (TPR) repeat protein